MDAIKFCPECHNVLSRREDKQRKTLVYACRHCDFKEDTSDYCVYRNVVHDGDGNQVHDGDGDDATRLQDAIKDPALPRTKSVECPRCGHKEAVVVLQKRGATPEDSMKFTMVCCNEECQNQWRA